MLILYFPILQEKPLEKPSVQILPEEYSCGNIFPSQGLVAMKITPKVSETSVLQVKIRKCDSTPFQVDGDAWIAKNGFELYGPYEYFAGDTSIDLKIDSSFQYFESAIFEANLYPTGQDYPNVSGEVSITTSNN